ncbi:hypothetical protein SAMN05443245_5867 [Paraburkholderia fungorum]|uniref:Uncharacterized protein n=1 Tax=Paraburkholderia fungorum TaxID=134537 RepID=A0A1H1IY23_9BURK|nr:hypothetical protein [Paraburkholderia fungorum]SDR42625.1 hypothetical protein SAMN05443245_5867 [Paraburkholderia fungorum]
MTMQTIDVDAAQLADMDWMHVRTRNLGGGNSHIVIFRDAMDPDHTVTVKWDALECRSEFHETRGDESQVMGFLLLLGESGAANGQLH